MKKKPRWTGLGFELWPEKRNPQIDFDSVKLFSWKGTEYWIRGGDIAFKYPQNHYGSLRANLPDGPINDGSQVLVVPREDKVFMFDYRVQEKDKLISQVLETSDLKVWNQVKIPSDSEKLVIKREGYGSAYDDDYVYVIGGKQKKVLFNDVLRTKDFYHWEYPIPKEMEESNSFSYFINSSYIASKEYERGVVFTSSDVK